MRDKKYYIALDDFERRVIVNCLNEMRNNLIANGKYTDAVDEVLLKIIDTKQKKFYKVIITCPTLPFLMKKNILSAYGDSGTYGISNNTAKCYTSIC